MEVDDGFMRVGGRGGCTTTAYCTTETTIPTNLGASFMFYGLEINLSSAPSLQCKFTSLSSRVIVRFSAIAQPTKVNLSSIHPSLSLRQESLPVHEQSVWNKQHDMVLMMSVAVVGG